MKLTLKHPIRTFLLSFLLSASFTPAMADFHLGMRAYKSFDYQTARKEFLKSATTGHTDSQFYLGEIYEGGVGIAIDYKAASSWYEKAANNNHSSAQARLAYLCHTGRGKEKNPAMAFSWYKKAAENGHYIAQYELAKLYMQGLGTQTDLVTAYKWFSIATSYGDTDAPAEQIKLAKKISEKDQLLATKQAKEWELNFEKNKQNK